MKLFKVFILGLLFTLFSGCELLDDSPCGVKDTYDLYLLGNNVFDASNGKLNTYMEGSNRVYQWSEIVEHVCTEEHVDSEFKVSFLDDKTASENNIFARGVVSWQFLFSNKVNLTANEEALTGSLNVGLKNAFPDLSGWFIPAVEIYFLSKGSEAADLAFITSNSKIISVSMTSKYRQYN